MKSVHQCMLSSTRTILKRLSCFSILATVFIQMPWGCDLVRSWGCSFRKKIDARVAGRRSAAHASVITCHAAETKAEAPALKQLRENWTKTKPRAFLHRFQRQIESERIRSSEKQRTPQPNIFTPREVELSNVYLDLT